MNWEDMKIFLAIAENAGLKKAARSLGIHHSSCARRIRSFELQLGVNLFIRLPTGYELTEEGEALHSSASLIRDEFNRVESEVLSKDTRLEGTINVTLNNGLATHLLMPDFTAFMTVNPEVKVKINMTYLTANLANREADVAIRHVDSPADSLAGKRIGRIAYSAYATQEYLNTHDLDKHPSECHWLGWGEERNHLAWAMKSTHPDIPVRGNMYSDVLQLSAAKSHMGIASLPCYMADPDPVLVRIPKAVPVEQDWLWVLAHKDMVRNTKVKAFIEFFSDAFIKHKKLLLGIP
ncbi:MAG: LysR family transcriptional regulator [Kangiellaceae bacterium]|nr:LysR family transcriptional regulator [Kangiellaceae bacterium]